MEEFEDGSVLADELWAELQIAMSPGIFLDHARYLTYAKIASLDQILILGECSLAMVLTARLLAGIGGSVTWIRPYRDHEWYLHSPGRLGVHILEQDPMQLVPSLSRSKVFNQALSFGYRFTDPQAMVAATGIWSQYLGSGGRLLVDIPMRDEDWRVDYQYYSELGVQNHMDLVEINGIPMFGLDGLTTSLELELYFRLARKAADNMSSLMDDALLEDFLVVWQDKYAEKRSEWWEKQYRNAKGRTDLEKKQNVVDQLKLDLAIKDWGKGDPFLVATAQVIAQYLSCESVGRVATFKPHLTLAAQHLRMKYAPTKQRRLERSRRVEPMHEEVLQMLSLHVPDEIHGVSEVSSTPEVPFLLLDLTLCQVIGRHASRIVNAMPPQVRPTIVMIVACSDAPSTHNIFRDQVRILHALLLHEVSPLCTLEAICTTCHQRIRTTKPMQGVHETAVLCDTCHDRIVATRIADASVLLDASEDEVAQEKSIKVNPSSEDWSHTFYANGAPGSQYEC